MYTLVLGGLCVWERWHSCTPTEDTYSTNYEAYGLKRKQSFKGYVVVIILHLDLSVKIHAFVHPLVQILFPFLEAIKTLIKRLLKSMYHSDNSQAIFQFFSKLLFSFLYNFLSRKKDMVISKCPQITPGKKSQLSFPVWKPSMLNYI